MDYGAMRMQSRLIGAGIALRDGKTKMVGGLTTAATIWVVAALASLADSARRYAPMAVA